MAVLQVKDGEEWKEIEAIQGPEGPDGPQGPKGESGVYTGTEEPSSDYDVWIEPDGTPGTIPTKTSDLTNDSGFIDKDVNTLTNYELKTNTGATIDLSIDSSTYVMTLALKNSAGTTISTDSIDLPLETMVVGASYDNQTKEIVLTLKNGNTTRFSVADLVSGLVSDTYLTTNYYNKSSVDTMIGAVSSYSETLKIGSIIPFAGSSNLPTGYMLCDGSAISRTNYSELFTIIGTSYGAGDGSTTFNLPNLKGKVPVGLDSNDTDFDTLGETGGEKEHTLTVDEIPAHSHSLNTSNVSGSNNANDKIMSAKADSTYNYNSHAEKSVLNTGGGQSHNNLQPYQVVNYIIKVAQTTATPAQVVDGYSTSTSDAYSANYVNNAIEDTYSTTETLTNKIWTNGKPIYRKVLTGTSKETIDISSLNIDELFINLANSYIHFTNPANRYTPVQLTTTVTSSVGNNMAGVYSNSTNTSLTLEGGSSVTIVEYKITIEYTKSTD